MAVRGWGHLRLVKITGIRTRLAALPQPDHYFYAVATIGARALGRSPIIDPSADEMDCSYWARSLTLANEQTPIAVAVLFYVDKQHDGYAYGPQMRFSVPLAFGTWKTPHAGTVQADGLTVHYELSLARITDNPSALGVPRTAIGTGDYSFIDIPVFAVTEITGVSGLWVPHLPFPGSQDQRRWVPAADADACSLDTGRVYINARADGSWHAEQQVIEVTARVTFKNYAPHDPTLLWSIIDLDDPSNDPTHVHREAGPFLDPANYDPQQRPIGPRVSDNEGAPTGIPWSAAPSHDLAMRDPNVAVSRLVYKETDSTGSGVFETKVRLQCPSVGGDNLCVEARAIEATLPGELSVAGVTGIMTMWKRVEVEYYEMEGARPLPIDKIAQYFEPAFVQLDFKVMPKLTGEDAPAFLAQDEDALDERADQFCARIFQGKNRGGTFCLVAAKGVCQVVRPSPKSLFQGIRKLVVADLRQAYNERKSVYILGEYVDVDGDLTHPETGAYSLTLRDSRGITMDFSVLATELVERGFLPRTRCWLSPHRLTDRFEECNGTLYTAYRHNIALLPHASIAIEDPGNTQTYHGNGYRMEADLKVEVFSRGASLTAGISPGPSWFGIDYFAGRTIVFTHHPDLVRASAAYFEKQAVNTIVHELAHGLGMPHKCGAWDHVTPRRQSCVMNYDDHWLVDAQRQPIPATDGKVGPRLCARHIKEIRRSNLVQNFVLRRLYWRDG